MKPVALLSTLALFVASANLIDVSGERTTVPVQTSTNFCQGCRALVSYVSHFNSTNEQDKYREVFKSFCDVNFPNSTDYQDGPCPFVVNGIYKAFEFIDPVHHCDDIGACGPVDDRAIGGLSEELRGLTDPAKAGICDICQQTVQQIRDFLDNPDAIQELRKKMDAFCEYLQIVNEEKQCKDVANNYLDQAVTFIKNIDPMGYCKAVHVCDSSASIVDPNTYNPIFGFQSDESRSRPSFVDFNKFGIETSVMIGDKVVKDIYSDFAPQSTVSKRPTPNCMLCKTIVKEIFKFVRDNRTEESIREGLDKVCKIAFHHYPDKEQECEELVGAYSREIIDLLTQETDPTLVCTLIDQCVYPQDKSNDATPLTSTNNEEAPTLGDLITKLDPSIGLNSPETCIECKLFIRYLQGVLEKPKSQEQAKNFIIKELCDSLDDMEVRKQCTQLVNQYAETFFKAVALELDPKVACIELGACKKSFTDLLFLDAPTQLPINQCAVCIESMEKTDEIISQETVHLDFADLADTVCSQLPNRKGCQAVFDRLGVRIGRGIMAMQAPKDICTPEFCHV